MSSIAELVRPKELLYNPGRIEIIDGKERWITQAAGHELSLKIVGVPNPESKFGIASFVVMEQKQPFLQDVGSDLAYQIHEKLDSEERILLITVETKGSHFIPYVWTALDGLIHDRLEERIVTIRKGEPKVYMKGYKEPAFSLSYHSITSSSEQKMVVSPEDIKLLRILEGKVTPWTIEDFLGGGGTLEKIWKYWERLGLEPPRKAAVIGSDSNLGQKKLQEAGVDIEFLEPFLLKLPLFSRENLKAPWQIS